MCNKGYSGIACEVKACPVGTILAHHDLLSTITSPIQEANATDASLNAPKAANATTTSPAVSLSFLELFDENAGTKMDICSNNGVCAPGIGGLCECGPGYYGEDCSCTHECYNDGTCLGGVCLCAYGWRGLNCSHTICPKDCSHRGKCVDERCECDVGFGNDDCSERRCPNKCSGHGLCDGGICICNDGFGGQDCGLEFHGKIDDMVCAASESFLNAFYNFRRTSLEIENPKIEQSSIPRVQSDLDFADKTLQQRRSDLQTAAGERSKTEATLAMSSVDLVLAHDEMDRTQLREARRNEKKLNMTAVRIGKAARRKWRSELNGIIGMCVRDIPCPHNCTSHVDPLTNLLSGGHCSEGKCACYPGWTGEDCGERSCFKDCNLHGACRHGICECDKNWEGPYCTIYMDFQCRKACSSRCDDRATIDSEAGGLTPEKEACKQKCFHEECAPRTPMSSSLPLESPAERIVHLQRADAKAGRGHTFLRR